MFGPRILTVIRWNRGTEEKVLKNMVYDVFVNCNWVATRWHYYSTHLHTHTHARTHTHTKHRTTQNKQYIEQHKNFGRMRAVPYLCRFYPGICLTTEEKVGKNLSQDIRRVPAGLPFTI